MHPFHAINMRSSDRALLARKAISRQGQLPVFEVNPPPMAHGMQFRCQNGRTRLSMNAISTGNWQAIAEKLAFALLIQPEKRQSLMRSGRYDVRSELEPNHALVQIEATAERRFLDWRNQTLSINGLTTLP
jgi:hypothetical protein